MPGWRLPFNPWFMFDRRHPVVRKATIAGGAVLAVLLLCAGALWWRLASGPIMLDLFTPWLTSAIEQNLGSRYRVEVGGTQLERDAQGRTALRLRDIVLRDSRRRYRRGGAQGRGRDFRNEPADRKPRAESFRLVDANMTIRIDPDGRSMCWSAASGRSSRSRRKREAQLNRRIAGDPGCREPAPTACPAIAAGQRPCSRCRRCANAALPPMSRPCSPGSTSSASSGSIRHRRLRRPSLNEIGITNGSLTIDDRRSGTSGSSRRSA
jgi:hypothetical protein